MPKFKKRPVTIEAVKILAPDFNPVADSPFDGFPFSHSPQWLVDAVNTGAIRPHSRNCTDYAEWDIETLEGVMSCGPDDWIIKGVKGEFYPCKPDIFAVTYEPVEAEDD